jgi:hypothetical protein
MSSRRALAEREDELEHTGGARNEKEKLLRSVGDVVVVVVVVKWMEFDAPK